MKIGIYLSPQDPTAGGTVVFEREVLTALLAAPSTRHEFQCYSPQAPLGSAEFPAPVKVVARSLTERALGQLERGALAVRKKLKSPADPLEIGGSDRRLVETLLSDGIEFLWSLSPARLTKEIPHALTIFDLQHRLQPQFPEVSSEGEWERRERIYEENLPRASLLITGTERGREELRQFYSIPPERVRVIPFPTPSFALKAAPTDPCVLEGLDLPERFLFYPAQFWPHKNHVGLLESLRRLRDDHQIELPLVLVGSDKGNQRRVRGLAQTLGLDVRFLGFVPDAQLVGLYQRAFALVFPSYFGPDNLPPLEAFALGCPVVAADVPGSEEQLGAAALRVPPGDHGAWAEALKSLHDDEALRSRLIERGEQRAASWGAPEYAQAVLSALDEFEAVRRCWD